MKSNQLAKILAASSISLLAACGQSDDDSTNAGLASSPRQVAFALTSAQGQPVSSATPTFSDDRGITYTLTEARAVIRHIELDLPAGTTCAQINAQLQGVTCERTDDNGVDDNPGADDNGADDNPGSDDAPGTDDNSGADDLSNHAKLRINGPFVVDLLTGQTTPSISSIRVPSLPYRRVDIRFDDADKDLALPSDDRLNEHTWVMRADFTHQGQQLTLDARLKFNEDARFEAAQGVSVDPDSPLLIAFSLDAWLNGLAIAQCLDDDKLQLDDRTITVSESSSQKDCSDLEGSLKDNLKNSARLR